MVPSSSMPREALRPYRYGMCLLCFGGLLNWLGLFENYAEPVRYIGVACVVCGALLLCIAIGCWIRPGQARREEAQDDEPVHVISVELRSPSVASQKPPDYEAVTDKPPSYEDAIMLSPAMLWLADEQERQGRQLLTQNQAVVEDMPRNSEEADDKEVTRSGERTAS